MVSTLSAADAQSAHRMFINSSCVRTDNYIQLLLAPVTSCFIVIAREMGAYDKWRRKYQVRYRQGMTEMSDVAGQCGWCELSNIPVIVLLSKVTTLSKPDHCPTSQPKLSQVFVNLLIKLPTETFPMKLNKQDEPGTFNTVIKSFESLLDFVH